MSLIKWSPLYEPFLDMERAFGELRGLSVVNPPIDLYEKDTNIIVDVALPGIDPENVKINIENDVLSIEASLEHQKEVDESNYYRKEVRTGAFHRVISLPVAVNGDAATAQYAQGLLSIIIPKKKEIQPKTISIEIKK